jgi:hypothetical protein
MTITIVIQQDNAAFGDDPNVETLRILADLITRYQDSGEPYETRLHDYNGNTVGSVRVNGIKRVRASGRY